MAFKYSFIDKIAKEYGNSFYILESEIFLDNFLRLINAFKTHYLNTNIAYSYKTNYVPRYCQLINQQSGFAEVVSSMEVELARKVGVDDSKIFFNGPYKDYETLKSLLSGGGLVNVDSFEELSMVSLIADSHQGPCFKIGLRCNFDVDDGVLSRFGFDVTSQVFVDAITNIDAHPSMELVGLHCHFAARSLSCWKNRTKGMIDVIDKFFRHRIEDLSYISLGGGMYGNMPDDLMAQFPAPIPRFEDYANVAAKPIAEYFNNLATTHRPILIIEPGTALVADAMKFVCKVHSVKYVRTRPIVTLTGSTYNINPSPNRKNVPISIISPMKEEDRELLEGAYFGGYTCIEGDYLYKNFSGRLSVGDYVMFDDVGSYSVVMKPPFILPNVAILEPDERKVGYKLIKRPETFNDIFNGYTFE